MINHEKKVADNMIGCDQDNGKATPPTPQLDQPNLDLLLLYKSRMSKEQRNPPLSLPTYGSRGSLMLKAALGDKNSQDNKMRKSKFFADSSNMQQVKLLNIKKRNPIKNKVLFSEPVVTSQYEYEPVQLSEQIFWNKSETDLERNQVKDESIGCYKSLSCPSTNSPIALSGLDQSPPRSHRKRSLKRKRPIYSEANPKDRSKDHENSGCDQDLFSPPKVAKIAPYYHDQLEKLASDLKSSRTKADKPVANQSEEEENNSTNIVPERGSRDPQKTGGFAQFFNSFDPTKMCQWFYQLVVPNYTHELQLVR